MTASTVKSTKVTNDLDSSPRTVEPAGKSGGMVKISVDTAEVATTSIDEIGDVVLMLPMQSNQRVHELHLYNDDLDSNGTPLLAVNVGIYNGPEAFTTSAGTKYAAYAVVDADCFASAITTLQAANTVGVNIRHEAGGTYDEIAAIGKKLWEVLNLPEDPCRTFVVGVGVTAVAATAAAGTVSVSAKHSD